MTVRVANPSRREIGGYQAFLRFSAEHFEALRFEPLEAEWQLATGGRPPLGDGYRPCSGSVAGGWDDLAGEDVVSVVASVFVKEGSIPITAAAADLGRFVFHPREQITGLEGVQFQSNQETCHAPFDQTTKVFGPDGRVLTGVEEPQAFSVIVTDGGPFVRNFLCADTGTTVTLSWQAADADGVEGYRIYRSGVQIKELNIRGVFEFVDSDPPTGVVTYQLAVLRSGRIEGCRDSCSLERQARFVRGEVDHRSGLSLTDAVVILNYLFGGLSLACQDAADADDNGTVNTTDAVRILAHLFRGGPVPPEPYPDLGPDPTPDSLTCLQ